MQTKIILILLLLVFTTEIVVKYNIPRDLKIDYSINDLIYNYNNQMKKFTGTVKTVDTGGLPVAPPITQIQPQTVQHASFVNVLPSIVKEDGSPLVTQEQAITLTSLRFSNGEVVMEPSDKYFSYEIVNMLNKINYEVVYNFLSTDWIGVFGNIPDIRRKILFDNPLLSSAKDKQLLDMEIFRRRIDVVEGGVKCKKCGSDNTISMEKQTRSADEPMTIMVTCQQCRHHWRAQ